MAQEDNKKKKYPKGFVGPILPEEPEMKFGSPDMSQMDEILKTLGGIQQQKVSGYEDQQTAGRKKLLESLGQHFAGGEKQFMERYPAEGKAISGGDASKIGPSLGSAVGKLSFTRKDPSSPIPEALRSVAGEMGIGAPSDEEKASMMKTVGELETAKKPYPVSLDLKETEVPPGGEQAPPGEQPGELEQAASKDAQEISKGVTTHDEADAKLRSTMGDDPELQSAIMEVRARLADAKKPESYGITDYLTAILLTLGGTPPTHAIEYVTQRGYKQGKADELEKQLLQLQMAGVGARRRQQEMGTQMDFQKEMLNQRLGSQEDIEGKKLGLQENKAGADYNRKLLSSYLQAQSQQMDPKEKVKYQTIINALQQQLQIPGGSTPQKPKPTSMVDPRLQRMGLNPGGSFA